MNLNCVIFENVQLARNVLVGEYCVIGRRPTPVRSVQKDLCLENDLVVIGEDSVLCPHVVIYAGVQIGKRVLIGDQSSVFCRVAIGDDVLISRHVTINSDVTIGNGTRIMDNTHITGRSNIGEHVFISVGISTCNDNLFGKAGYSGEIKGQTIEDYVSIGAGATLLPGICIGRGSIIAAGSVIKSDIPPDTMVSGNPGKVICRVPRNLRRY